MGVVGFHLHLIRGGTNNWAVVRSIKVRIGVIPCFFDVYASTAKFSVIDFKTSKIYNQCED